MARRKSPSPLTVKKGVPAPSARRVPTIACPKPISISTMRRVRKSVMLLTRMPSPLSICLNFIYSKAKSRSTDATALPKGQRTPYDRSTPGQSSMSRSVDTERPDSWKNSTDGVNSTAVDTEEGYSRSRTSRRAKKTYALTDPTAPSRTPQVLYIPSGRRLDSKGKNASLDEEVSGSISP